MWNKVEARVVDHLSDFGTNGEEYEAMESFFMKEDRKYEDC